MGRGNGSSIVQTQLNEFLEGWQLLPSYARVIILCVVLIWKVRRTFRVHGMILAQYLTLLIASYLAWQTLPFFIAIVALVLITGAMVGLVEHSY